MQASKVLLLVNRVKQLDYIGVSSRVMETATHSLLAYPLQMEGYLPTTVQPDCQG